MFPAPGVRTMSFLKYYKKPKLDQPLVIVGFNGWANAGDVVSRSISYIIQKLNAPIFAEIKPDRFFNFESSRPMVEIQGGQIVSFVKPRGRFHCRESNSEGRDLIIFLGDEPHHRWETYCKLFLDVVEEFGASMIITLSSTYDQVLHYEEKVSAIVSDVYAMNLAREMHLPLLDCTSDASISLFLISEAETKGISALGLWAHAPFYIQGTNFKLCSRIIGILSVLAGIEVDTFELEKAWASIERQINALVEKNERLRHQIREISQITGTQFMAPNESFEGAKIIQLEDFFKKKDKS